MLTSLFFRKEKRGRFFFVQKDSNLKAENLRKWCICRNDTSTSRNEESYHKERARIQSL